MTTILSLPKYTVAVQISLRGYGLKKLKGSQCLIGISSTILVTTCEFSLFPSIIYPVKYHSGLTNVQIDLLEAILLLSLYEPSYTFWSRTQEYIENCKTRLILPIKSESFQNLSPMQNVLSFRICKLLPSFAFDSRNRITLTRIYKASGHEGSNAVPPGSVLSFGKSRSRWRG